MSKLYIPTTTLNFNNIFSSESISPAGFYLRRGFGYQTFSKIALNSLENSILLFSKLPVFEIPANDFDDYPMIIEIEKEEFFDDLKPIKQTLEIDIFQTEKTVYLNPFSTYIYFLDSKHLRIALSKAEASAETKLVGLYRNCFVIFNKQVDYSELNVIDCGVSDYKEISPLEIEKDRKIDRIKGFAYSYVIGANKSLRKDIVCIKKQSRIISNIVSSVLNSLDGIASDAQKLQLDNAINSFNYSQLSEIINEINSIGETKRGSEILNFMMNKYSIKLPLSFDANRIKYSLNDNKKCNEAIQLMFDYVCSLEENHLKIIPKLIWKNSIAISSGKLTAMFDLSVIEKSKSIYQSLINEVLTSSEFTGRTYSPKRFELITSIVLNIKRTIEAEGEKWEDSHAREPLNNLRKNVGGDNVPFHIKWDNGVLPAIAAFILKGDEHEKLEAFLIDNEIADYRLAFGFHGALFGFSGLSKTFTNFFFEFSDKEYIHSVYKQIFSQLHNIELVEVYFKNNSLIQNPIGKQRESIHESDDIELICKELEKYDPKVKSNIIQYKELIKEFGLTDSLIKAIKKNNLKAKTNAEKFFKNKIQHNIVNSLQKQKTEEPQLSLYPIAKCSEFCNDPHAWEYISGLIPPNYSKEVKKDFIWFQSEWKNPNSKYYSISNFPRTNDDAINSYKGFLNKKKSKEFKLNYAKHIPVDEIINKLREEYNLKKK